MDAPLSHVQTLSNHVYKHRLHSHCRKRDLSCLTTLEGMHPISKFAVMLVVVLLQVLFWCEVEGGGIVIGPRAWEVPCETSQSFLLVGFTFEDTINVKRKGLNMDQ